MVVRNVEIIRDATFPQKGCLIETTKPTANIKNLFLSNIEVNRMDTIISHKNGKIDTIQVNNILSSEMGDAVITTDQNIRQVNASAVFGTILISANSQGKIDNIS